MKKLQIPITEELMNSAKLHAFQNGTTLKEVVIKALESYITSNTTNTITTNTTPTTYNTRTKVNTDTTATTTITSTSPTTDSTSNTYAPKKYPSPLDDEYQNEKKEDFYLLRKPAYRGDVVKESTKFTDGVVEWELLPGSIPHYDADGKLIPFACTMEFNNKLYWPPFENEIEEIAEAYGKPVKIEE
jgi:hypothetical protein